MFLNKEINFMMYYSVEKNLVSQSQTRQPAIATNKFIHEYTKKL